MQFTFTCAIWSSQNSTLLYAAKGLKQPSDILVALLLSQHAYKQLPVLWEAHKEETEDGKTTLILLKRVITTPVKVGAVEMFMEAYNGVHQGAVSALSTWGERENSI